MQMRYQNSSKYNNYFREACHTQDDPFEILEFVTSASTSTISLSV